MTTVEHAGAPAVEQEGTDPLLKVSELVVDFPTKDGVVQAVSKVSFDLRQGETLSIVGESGSGKSTIAKAVMQLVRYQSGVVELDGQDLAGLSRKKLRETRPELQMIFQDPIASLNPRRVVEKIVGEGLNIWPHKVQESIDADVDKLLLEVGMKPDVVRGRKAGEFSGGQCQRLAIARVLALKPRVVVCDEPVSALDVSVQAQILNLLRRMRLEYGLTMLFISHDLSVVRNISDRVLVMYLGKVCEIADTATLFDTPAHPYTQLLLESVPRAGQAQAAPRREANKPVNELPSPLNPPSGCRFRTRCPLATDRCAQEEPPLRELAGRTVACHHAEKALTVGAA